MLKNVGFSRSYEILGFSVSCRQVDWLRVSDQALQTYRRVYCPANKIADMYDRLRDIPRAMIHDRLSMSESRAVN